MNDGHVIEYAPRTEEGIQRTLVKGVTVKDGDGAWPVADDHDGVLVARHGSGDAM